MIQLVQRVFVEFADPTNHPRAEVWVPPEYTLTGGGAIVLWGEAGNILTSSYPIKKDGEAIYTGWEARAKDHKEVDLAPLIVYAIGIKLLTENGSLELDQDVVKATSIAPVNHPKLSVKLVNVESVLTGGGAFVDWKNFGNFLTASFPISSDGNSFTGWEARAKDHIDADPASISVYAIGVNLPNSVAESIKIIQKVIVKPTTTPVNHPRGDVSMDDGFTLTGGGAIDNWDTAGNLLTASFPTRRPGELDYKGWNVRGKDHKRPDISTVTCYAIGIKATSV